MRIEGEHAFTASRERVWDALNDPVTLARALPGAERLDAVGPDEYALTVSVGVGAVRGTYEGTFALSDKRANEACTVRASASGAPGSVETVARMSLRDGDGGGAVMSYEADATVTGALSGVGQRLVAAAARRTTGEFLEALDRAIAAPAGAPPVARRRIDPLVVAVSALGGALVGVTIGRWSRRR
jgi:carbon monoxide dehydrogenase subunit G